MAGIWQICERGIKICPNGVCAESVRRLQSIGSIRIGIEMDEHSVCTIDRPFLNERNHRLSGGGKPFKQKCQDQATYRKG